MLTEKIAQRIADEVMENLGYNINVMNDQGIIIGSGSPARIGTFHESALQVIRDKAVHEVTEEDALDLYGVLPGINLPIVMGDKIVGVVGITGNPKEVRSIGRLVKMAAELIVDQEESSYRYYMHRNDKGAFVTNLLNESAPNHTSALNKWADTLGYDLALTRVACLFEFGSGSPTIRQYDDYLESMKSSAMHLRQDISVSLGDQILVFKALSSTNPWVIEKEVTDYVDSMVKTLSFDVFNSLRCFVGGYHQGITNYRHSYTEALSLKASLHGSGDRLSFSHRNPIGSVFDLLGEDTRHYTLTPYVNKLTEAFGESTGDMVLTAEKLIANGFHYEQTAAELFVHKNTIAFRKNKLDSVLGIDPKGDSRDLVLLMLILAQYHRLKQ